MKIPEPELSIGALARRTGLSVSAIRFYESRGLIVAGRNAGGQRRFKRGDIRRLSFVMIVQRFGFSIEEIAAVLADLPSERTPTAADWARLGGQFRAALEARITTLTKLRDQLDGCIGCGCLSLERCCLVNPDDRAGRKGAGPRFLMGDTPENVETQT